ncbi:hypothetical protein LguiA_029101 [Lonicera macranthoides]
MYTWATYNLRRLSVLLRGIRRAEFRILTQRLDSYWRNLDYVPEKLGFYTWSGVCCVDDVIFCSGWVNSNKVIVAFEVGLEKFRVIPLPNGADSGTTEPHIIQIGGHLGFIHVYTKVTNGDAMTSHDEWSINYDIVDVMDIWVLEDYHKQHWKKEIFTVPSQQREKHYGIKSIHSCSYYDLESKSLRIVPKVTEFPKHYEDHKKNLRFVGFTKHLECLFKLKVT